MPSICIEVLENPHIGCSGVPFMNKTTGAEATALSIAVRTSFERNLVCAKDCEMRGRRVFGVAEGRRAASAPRSAYGKWLGTRCRGVKLWRRDSRDLLLIAIACFVD